MALSVRIIRMAALLVGAAAFAPLASPTLAQSRPASAADINVPLSDARKIEPDSVRFSATQFTRTAPTVVIFGVSKANWPLLRAAIQQAVFEGYPVDSIFIGPQNAAPSLEIYAKGVKVTNPINPNAISAPELTRLIGAIVREYYR